MKEKKWEKNRRKIKGRNAWEKGKKTLVEYKKGGEKVEKTEKRREEKKKSDIEKLGSGSDLTHARS